MTMICLDIEPALVLTDLSKWLMWEDIGQCAYVPVNVEGYKWIEGIWTALGFGHIVITIVNIVCI